MFSKSPQPPKIKDPTKRSLTERILSAIFDGPSGTNSSKTNRELRENFESDKLDLPRTAQEEKERRGRMMKRGAIVGGGDGVRPTDMNAGVVGATGGTFAC